MSRCASLEATFGDYVPTKGASSTIAVKEIQDVLNEDNATIAVLEFFGWAITRGFLVRVLNSELVILARL